MIASTIRRETDDDRHVRMATNINSRFTQRLRTPCPYCGGVVWRYPAIGCTLCANPACGGRYISDKDMQEAYSTDDEIGELVGRELEV